MMASRKLLQATVLAVSLAAAVCALAACSPITALNDLTPHSTYREVRGLAYGTNPHQQLDVYMPAGAALARSTSAANSPTGQGRPIVVFFYGGSWQNGNRGEYLFAGAALASRGFVAVLPDYRTYPETTFPGFIDDAAAAVRWARDHAREFGGDPSRLFLMGHSAGAQIVVLLGTDAHYLAARQMSKSDLSGVIGLAGPYDFLPLKDATLEKIFPPDLRPASQPINFVSGTEPPMFLAAGKLDKVVDPGNTDRMAAKLRAAGDSVEVKHYPAIGHILLAGALSVPLRHFAPVLSDVTQFIDAH